jgi:hypothetical protein
MKGTTGRTGRAFAALAFLGTLGFGTVQAFAASGAPAALDRACSISDCRANCIAGGASGGSCKWDSSSGEYFCQCNFIG